MIEYLESLLEQKGQEQEVLELAEDMLKNRPNSPHEALVIQIAILRARATSGHFDLAITPGNLALELSRELGEWDYFGIACLFLGTAYGMLGQPTVACSHLVEYLQYVHLFDKAKRFHSNVWFNLGMFYLDMNESSKASDAFVMSAKTSSFLKGDRWEHGVRQALVVQLLRTAEWDKIPGLMATCSYYLRHSGGSQTLKSRLFYLESRVKFAWATNRMQRAKAIVGRGLLEAHGDAVHLANLHMLYARMVKDTDDKEEALHHASTAKFYARRSGIGILENDAINFLCDTLGITLDQASGMIEIIVEKKQ